LLEAEPSIEELAAFGLTREDVAEQHDVDVWPDCWTSVSLFVDLLTQWRVGPAGHLGIDYTAIPVVMDLRDIPREERSAVFDDLRVMECEALKKMRRKK
jgi:hypothetical protein